VSLDPKEIIIAGNHRIHVAPEGTPLPSSISDPLDIAFVDLGYTTEAGAKFSDNKVTGQVLPSQSFYSVRDFVTSREAMIDFIMLQWNRDTVQLAFGGGTWTEPNVDHFRYHPPAPETLAVNAIVLDGTDGTRHFRIAAGRGFVTSNTVVTFARTGPGELPITLKILAPAEGGDPWTFDTDDEAAFGLVGS
jgi:hypothetical protein